MNTSGLIKSQFLQHSSLSLFPIHSNAPPKSSSLNINPASSGTASTTTTTTTTNLVHSSADKSVCCVVKSNHRDEDEINDEELKRRRLKTMIVTGAASVGVLAVLMGHDKAWALGPEGPMVEEFWENVRRYALYALTVSTGVLYAVLQPIVELLKNPISALLVIIIIGGSFFIFSQILSAMFGVSDFAYQYAY